MFVLLFKRVRVFGVSCAERGGEGAAGLETDCQARHLRYGGENLRNGVWLAALRRGGRPVGDVITAGAEAAKRFVWVKVIVHLSIHELVCDSIGRGFYRQSPPDYPNKNRTKSGRPQVFFARMPSLADSVNTIGPLPELALSLCGLWLGGFA